MELYHVYVYTRLNINMTEYVAHEDLGDLVESVFNSEYSQLSDGGLSILKYGSYTYLLGVF